MGGLLTPESPGTHQFLPFPSGCLRFYQERSQGRSRGVPVLEPAASESSQVSFGGSRSVADKTSKQDIKADLGRGRYGALPALAGFHPSGAERQERPAWIHWPSRLLPGDVRGAGRLFLQRS